MDGATLGLIELALVFGGVLAFGAWELYSLRKYRRRKAAERQQDPAGPPSDNRP